MTKRHQSRKSGPQSNTAIRHKAIVEIMSKYDTISPTKIVEYLKTDYGIETTRQTVTDDLKKDLETLTADELKNRKTGILSSIDELTQAAKEIALNMTEDAKVRLSAMTAYSNLVKTHAEVLKKFEQASIALKAGERPVYNILIGKPSKADLEKLGNSDESKKLEESLDRVDTGEQGDV